MRKIILSILFCHVLLFGFSQTGQIVIPMDLSTNRPIVEVEINGKGPYRFIFDTGAGTNVIDNDLVDELGLKLIGEDSLRSQGDNRLVSKRYETNSLAIVGSGISKTATLNAIGIRNMVQVDGIIGNQYALDYLVTLDYPGSRLILERSELNKNDPGVLDFVQQPRVINLNIEISGNTVETHLDTGNPYTFLVPNTLRDKLTFEKEPVKGDPLRTAVGTHESWYGKVVGEIKIGDVVFENPEVILAEGFDSANIGYGALKDLQVTIDIKNHLISFKESVGSNSSASKSPSSTAEVPAAYQEFVGTYGNGSRVISIEDGKLWAKRAGGPKLELVPVEGGLYQLTYVQRTNNELPKARFDRDANGKVIGMTYVLLSGQEDSMKKD